MAEMLPEDDLIQTLFAPLALPLDDDCAVIDGFTETLLVSSDALVEDIHFLRSADPEDVAVKALAANISDIVACGGQPLYYQLTLSLPKNLDPQWPRAFAQGLARVRQQTGIQLSGGDTTASPGPIFINITIFGKPVREVITRRGIQPDDLIVVSGRLGDAALGLSLILDPRTRDDQRSQSMKKRHYHRPYRLPLWLVASRPAVRAAMDLSDGVATDLARLCRLNQLGAVVHLEKIPLSNESGAFGLTPEGAVTGGEDYELLLVLPPEAEPLIPAWAEAADVPLTVIGNFQKGNGPIFVKKGEEVTLPRSWQHW